MANSRFDFLAKLNALSEEARRDLIAFISISTRKNAPDHKSETAENEEQDGTNTGRE